MLRVDSTTARSNLSQLIDLVEAGESVLITRDGNEVAQLVPAKNETAQTDLKAMAEKWKKTRKGLSLRGLTVRELKNEGRR